MGTPKVAHGGRSNGGKTSVDKSKAKKTAEAMTADSPGRVVCSECGYSMAMVRNDPSPVAAMFRYECSNCDATGTVEYRGDWSPARRKGTFTHGAATIPEGETDD